MAHRRTTTKARDNGHERGQYGRQGGVAQREVQKGWHNSTSQRGLLRGRRCLLSSCRRSCSSCTSPGVNGLARTRFMSSGVSEPPHNLSATSSRRRLISTSRSVIAVKETGPSLESRLTCPFLSRRSSSFCTV